MLKVQLISGFHSARRPSRQTGTQGLMTYIDAAPKVFGRIRVHLGERGTHNHSHSAILARSPEDLAGRGGGAGDIEGIAGCSSLTPRSLPCGDWSADVDGPRFTRVAMAAAEKRRKVRGQPEGGRPPSALRYINDSPRPAKDSRLAILAQSAGSTRCAPAHTCSQTT